MAFVLPALTEAASVAYPWIQSALASSAVDYGFKKVKKALKLKKGGKVPYNKKPLCMQSGARVSAKRGMTGYQKRNDSVHALLMPGEIVIPKYYQKSKKKRIALANQVEKYLKRQQINLPNM